MLLPTATNLSHLSTSRLLSSSGQATSRAMDQPPAPSVTSATQSARGGGDLRAEIAALMERDLDYQILRKSFALDRVNSTALSAERTHSIGSGQNAYAASLGDGSIEAASFDLQVSWSRQSSSRFEFSASSVDLNFALQSADFQRQAAQLSLSIGNLAPVQTGDPLVLDLSGQGITTTGVDAGVQFDLTGDGQLEQVSFVTGDSWFLALDSNDNGRIDSGRELFGDQNGAAHGFAELARHDGNADGVIDASDEVFARLRLFQMGSDGEQVLQSLAEAGVTAIDLGYQNTRKALNVYDYVAQIGQFQRSDGSTGEASDLQLGYRRLA